MTARKGLGRGLGALIKDETPVDQPVEPKSGITKVPIDRIQRNRWQPRHTFDQEALAELTASIREHGVIQPLLVREAENGQYMLIAGERRLRASGEAGLEEVPVIIIEATDGDALELALIENLQRQDLNVIEEAEGYRELADQFNLTQEEIAERVSKSRATVANILRLLNLPEEVRAMLADQRLSTGHAKVLLSIDGEENQVACARRAVSENMTVRQLERLKTRLENAPKKPRAVKNDLPQSHISYLSDRLHLHFGTSVRISPCRTFANGKKGKGSIEIDFFSNDDLDRILSLLGLSTHDED